MEEVPEEVLQEATLEVKAYRLPAMVLVEVLVEAWLQERPVHFRMVGKADSVEVVHPLAPSLLAMKLARAKVQVLGEALAETLADNQALGALALAIKQVSLEPLAQEAAHPVRMLGPLLELVLAPASRVVRAVGILAARIQVL